MSLLCSPPLNLFCINFVDDDDDVAAMLWAVFLRHPMVPPSYKHPTCPRVSVFKRKRMQEGSDVGQCLYSQYSLEQLSPGAEHFVLSSADGSVLLNYCTASPQFTHWPANVL